MEIVPLHKIPSVCEAQEIVRTLVEKGLVSLTKHAKERMLERNITMPQILTCLAKGRVTENPVLANKNDRCGGYEIVIERSTAGDYLRVVVSLRFSQRAMVVTAIKIK